VYKALIHIADKRWIKGEWRQKSEKFG